MDVYLLDLSTGTRLSQRSGLKTQCTSRCLARYASTPKSAVIYVIIHQNIVGLVDMYVECSNTVYMNVKVFQSLVS